MGNDQPIRPMTPATAEDAARDAATIKMILYLSGFMPTDRDSSSPKARTFSLQRGPLAEGYC
jgi:hypothetical protein